MFYQCKHLCIVLLLLPPDTWWIFYDCSCRLGHMYTACSLLFVCCLGLLLLCPSDWGAHHLPLLGTTGSIFYWIHFSFYESNFHRQHIRLWHQPFSFPVAISLNCHSLSNNHQATFRMHYSMFNKFGDRTAIITVHGVLWPSRRNDVGPIAQDASYNITSASVYIIYVSIKCLCVCVFSGSAVSGLSLVRKQRFC